MSCVLSRHDLFYGLGMSSTFAQPTLVDFGPYVLVFGSGFWI